MKRLFFLCLILFGVHRYGVGQKSAHFGAPKFVPTDGQKLLIIGQDLGSVGGLESHSNGYIDNIDTHFPAGVTTYTDIPNLGGLASLRNWGAGDVHAQAYADATDFDQTFIVIGLYMVGRLSGIKDGFFNNSIRTLANWCKGQERPIFIRIGYEFEGPWNDYDPGHFKEAWKQIVHVFDEEEVQNVAYVWQSAGLNRGDIERWYPGDEYVNWVGYSHFDGFNMGRSISDFADEHDKPIMIAEAAPRRQLKTGSPEGHWRSWFLPLFERIYENDRIKALAYINADWESQNMWRGQGWGDSRVEVVDYIKNAWLSEMAKDVWLTSSDTLFDVLQYQTWVDSLSTNIAEPIPSEQIEVTKSADVLQVRSLDHQPIEKVKIWDIQGRLIFQNDRVFIQEQIPTHHLPAGLILVLIKKNGRLFRHKEMILSH